MIFNDSTMPRVTRSRAKARAMFRPWPFVAAVSIITFFVAAAYIQDTVLGTPSSQSLLRARSEVNHCSDVHQAQDVCAYVKANCEHDQPSLIPYLTIYYCTFGYARVAGFVLLVLWLGLLFSTIGIAASDFFTPNLQTIATVLNMPENLTGVTFLALGNGSPDLSSTIMSMRSNSAALAVGELIGAACFITAIVAGSIAMIREFKVDKQSFVRDLMFFIVAVTFTLGFLLDGALRFSECIFMIGYYACYVLVVSGSHFYVSNRERRVARAEERARAVEESLQEGGQERYRDEGDSAAGQAQEPPGFTAPDFTPAEGARPDAIPHIEIEGTEADQEPESESEHRKHISAEIANSMRVRRSMGGRRNTGNLIRPSLVGALELNSALNRFREDQAEQRHPAHSRRHSMQNVPQVNRSRVNSSMSPTMPTGHMVPATRDRAVSHTGNVTAPMSRSGPMLHDDPNATIAEGSTAAGQSTPRRHRPRLSARSFQLDGNLAVPPPDQTPTKPEHPTKRTSTGPRSLSPSMALEIPRPRSTSSERSEVLSPFPGLSDSPDPMTPTSEVGEPQLPNLPLLFSAANIANNNVNNFYANETDGGDYDYHEHQPALRWWPYSILPSPETIAATLFPTLQNWSDKGTMDAFVSALSVPSVFLLSVTLPVVDTRGPDPDEDSECTRLNAGIEASRRLVDTEWDEFRRHRRMSSRDSSARASPTPLSPMSAGDVPLRHTGPIPKVVRGPDDTDGGEALSEVGSITSEELMGWNKWQVLLQVVAGPPFATLITTSILLDEPREVTLAAIRWSTVASAVLFLLVLLTTKQGVRPRFHSFFCFPGFLISVAWIAAIAGEVVGALKAIGVIWSISEAILGLTIFAAGNSVGDWVSNYTIARLGSPVMAL